MNTQPQPRTFTVRHHPDYHPGATLHWRLYTYGSGRWCESNGHSGSFTTEAEAEEEGRLWVETGLGAAARRSPHYLAREAAEADARRAA